MSFHLVKTTIRKLVPTSQVQRKTILRRVHPVGKPAVSVRSNADEFPWVEWIE